MDDNDSAYGNYFIEGIYLCCKDLAVSFDPTGFDLSFPPAESHLDPADEVNKMNPAKNRLTGPLKGLLFGTAAFLLAFIPELILARFTAVYLILALVVLFSGLVFLKFMAGPLLSWTKTLAGGIVGILAAGFTFYIFLLIYFNFFDTSQSPSAFNWAFQTTLLFLPFGVTFGLLNFGPSSLQSFLPVFSILPFAASFLIESLFKGSAMSGQINTIALDLIGIPAEFMFSLLALGPLLGLSIGLFRRIHPHE